MSNPAVPFSLFKLRETAVVEHDNYAVSEALTKKAPAATPVGNYAYPGVNPFEGTAAYMSFNWINNYKASDGQKDYLFVPLDSVQLYFDASTYQPSSFLWTAPGGTPAQSTMQDLEVAYKTEGRYEFPTINATNASGTGSYKAPGFIKAGGRAEIALFNSRELATTFKPLYFTYGTNANKGFAGGSNTWGDLKYGNLFFVQQDSAYVESVSVYVKSNPTAADPNNKIKVGVYEPGEDAEQYFVGDSKLLGFAELKVSEIMPQAYSVTGILQKNGKDGIGLAEFKFDKPIKVKGSYFVTFENFGNDLVNGDSICVLANNMDPIPEDVFSTVESNSSWLYGLKTDNVSHMWFPFSYVSNKKTNLVLMICPIVNYGTIQTGIKNLSEVSFKIFSYKNGIRLNGLKQNCKIALTNMWGQTKTFFNNNESITIDNLQTGVYIISIGNERTRVLVY